MTPDLTRVASLFQQARRRALVISAYVKASTIDALLSAMPNDTERAVFARWGAADIASGASDWQVWDVAAEYGVPLFACPDLHAKVYVADERALVGSANATPSGLGHGAKSNLELLLEVRAGTREVAELIAQVRDASSLAPPFGPDVTSKGDPKQPEESRRRPLIWIPESDPDAFLQAIVGQAHHNEETENDRVTLGLGAEPCKRSDIMSATREMTAFRLVRGAFRTRMIGMRQGDLVGLLCEQVDSSCADLPVQRLTLLARWLGVFGENTHLAPTGPGEEPVLVPGPLLSSDHH